MPDLLEHLTLSQLNSINVYLRADSTALRPITEAAHDTQT